MLLVNTRTYMYEELIDIETMMIGTFHLKNNRIYNSAYYLALVKPFQYRKPLRTGCLPRAP
jgi:hypothetical protein